MKNFGKIAGINIVLLLIYSLVIRLVSGSGGNSNDRALGIAITSAFAVAIHVAVCLIVMIVAFASGTRESGRAWLATTGVVLLVGFSVCLGNSAL